MSDWFYRTLVVLGRPAFWTSSRPTVINADVTNRPGPFLLAANHTSPYDIPILMRHCHRRIDFVSITEVFRNPFTAWLYGNMNAFPLERSRPDAPAVRTILERLENGRVVGMFPEGGFRRGEASVVHSRQIRPGIGRISMLAKVPIIPCAIIGSEQYSRPISWLPQRRVRYGVAFGDAIEAGKQAEPQLVDAIVNLHGRLLDAMEGVTP